MGPHTRPVIAKIVKVSSVGASDPRITTSSGAEVMKTDVRSY